MSAAEAEVKTVVEVSAPDTDAVEVEIQHPHDSHDEEYESADDAYEEEIEEIEVEEEIEDDEEERSPSQLEKDKELDDDEDAKNPQFIPKRGYFYEHDDRTKADEEEEEPEEPKKEEKKKPKDPDRWSHDLYNENDQTPKSKDELSRAYGYDIWTEEQAPRARRRRRYGRGPNTYTRKWDEEEAYQKPRGGGFRGRGPRGRGNVRGSNSNNNRRGEIEGHDEGREGPERNVHDEEFPALPSENVKSTTKLTTKAAPKPSSTSESRESFSYRPNSQDARNQDYDNRGDHTSRGRGYGGGGRGRGRRNEFSNRNRYARREGDDGYEGTNQGAERDRSNRPAAVASNNESKDMNYKNRPPNPHTNGHVRDKDFRTKDNSLPSKPPFTNTEYTGSHSLTANRSNNKQPTHNEDKRGVQGRKNVLADKGFTDARELINAKRNQQQQQKQQQSSQQSQQAQLQPQNQQNLKQHPTQNKQQQQNEQQPPQGKSKRFSAQRQRQTETQGSGTGVNTSGVPMSHVTNMMPVVSGAEQMVSSPVPPFPQAPNYYEGAQVYETSGSPVTVAVSGNGPSVSPSLWAPHGFTSAPYPSPPTGPQVPPAAYGDHAAYLAAQQGAPIYTAPPQFIQDPGMMNYGTAPPPFAPAYHPQGYPGVGYPQVTPAPPPELYHAGVTYYNPQPQIHRQPMMAPTKRTKTVLQLVEPPEKTKGHFHHYDHSQSQSPPMYMNDPHVHGHVEQADLVQQFDNVSIVDAQPQPQVIIEGTKEQRKPSPVPEHESWSAQMEEISSPTLACPPSENSRTSVVSQDARKSPNLSETTKPRAKSVSPSKQQPTEEKVCSETSSAEQ